METISVIIPVYKAEAFLRRCVDSVLAQSWSNLEVILVDDGSPDQSGELCEQIASEDSRVKVIHQKNAGAAAARNAGVAAATGQYIAFVDSDDHIDSNMLEKLHSVLIEYDADIAECGYRWVKPDRVLDKENTGTVDIYTNLEALDKLYFGDQMFGGLSIVVWNKLYKSELIKPIRFPEGIMFEDCVYMPMVYFRSAKIAKINLNMYNFCLVANSVTRSSYSLKQLDAITAYRMVLDFLRKNNLERLYQYVQNVYFGILYHHYYECRLRRQEKTYEESMKKIRSNISAEYDLMIKNPFAQGSLWRFRLFRISPTCWFAVMWAGKTFKHYRWLIRHKKRLWQEKRNPKSCEGN